MCLSFPNSPNFLIYFPSHSRSSSRIMKRNNAKIQILCCDSWLGISSMNVLMKNLFIPKQKPNNLCAITNVSVRL